MLAVFLYVLSALNSVILIILLLGFHVLPVMQNT